MQQINKVSINVRSYKDRWLNLYLYIAKIKDICTRVDIAPSTPNAIFVKIRLDSGALLKQLKGFIQNKVEDY